MGYAVAWIAFRGIPTQDALARLRLSETASVGSWSDFDLCFADLPSGWHLVSMRNPVHRIVHPSVLKQLSLGCEVLGFQAIESIMASAAFLYRNGKRVWNVAHEPDSSVEHLAIDGDMPAEFGSIRAARFAQQKLDDADQDFVFEVPVDLAAQIAGYRYDENSAITFRKLRAA